MIALIAAAIMVGFFAGTYALAYVVGVWVGKRGGTLTVLSGATRSYRRLVEARRSLVGGKHRGPAVSLQELIER